MTTTSALFDLAASLGDHIDHARKASRNLERLPAKERVENIVVLGMGESGAAGDLLVAVASPFIPVPITVVKGYELPAFVGEGSLVFAISMSGNTEEVIDAATDAAVQGAKIVVITSGGRLAELGGSWAATIVRVARPAVPGGTSIGALAIPALAVLEDIGLFVGASQWIDLAVEQIQNRVIDLQQADNVAERLAKQITGKIVVVQGGGAIGTAAAQWWKSRINRNAQTTAFWSAQPEASHNEVAAWSRQAGALRDVVIVSLRHESEHPQVVRRFEALADTLVDANVPSFDVHAQGDGELAQLLDLYLIGDFVSLYLADALDVDPAHAPVAEEPERSLAGR
jgi:glucose/mannose-6-phosphate isomerase